MSIPIETLASYVPNLLARHFAVKPMPGLAPSVERFAAAVLFADVVGFTPLAERLAESGSEGAETLTRMLNAYFGRLIELVSGHGGDIVKFSGDGLLALWPAGDAETLAAAARRATQCGLEVQRQLFRYPVAADVNLSLHLSIGAGEVSAIYVGGLNERWELVLAGAPLKQVSLAGQQAKSGQVVVSREAAALLGQGLSGEVLPDGNRRARDLQPPLPPKPRVPAPPAEGMSAELAAFVPAALRTRLAAGQGDWVAELRRLSVLFIHWPELDDRTELQKAQAMMIAVQAAIYRFEGSILQLGVDDKGVSLIAVFGLPPLAHEDDATRAVRAALAVQATLREMRVRNAIGVTTGRAFCGPIGNDRRRAYGIMGDVINLASRLMQAAPGDILCDTATYQLARTHLTFETLPPLTVKGKAAPVPVFRPDREAESLSPAAARHTERSIVGRSAERTALAEKLAALQAGSSSVVIIEGEAGIGKSRLIDDLKLQAAELDVVTLAGAGNAVEQSTPYLAWHGIFAQLFNVDALPGDNAPPPEQILTRLEEQPDWMRLAPLLDAVLPVELTDNEITSQMTGQVRADNVQALLTSLLQQAARAKPLVLLIEDAHWLDSASWALMRMVVRDVRPLLLVIATRPFSDDGPAEYRELLKLQDTLHLTLGVLPAADVLTLLARRLGARSIPAAVAEFIQAKAEGHPFFSEELAYALRDAGLIRISEGECRLAPDVDLSAVSFPDTIQGVITSRIDRLTPAEQLALKVASVIGRIFAYRTLSEIYPLEADKQRLRDYLTTLERVDLTPLDTPEPNLAYMFKHVITQEVAYNLMLFGQRRELHRAIAEWYEREYEADLAAHSPVLAFHWDKAQDEPKAITYLEMAGEQMLQNGIYREAVTYFSDLLRREPQGQGTDTPAIVISRRHRITAAQLQRACWERKLGQAYLGLGNLVESQAHFTNAAALLGWPTPAKPNLSLVRQLAQQLSRRAGLTAQQSRTTAVKSALLEAAHVYEGLGEIYYFANQSDALIDAWLRTLNLAERASSAPELAREYANVSLAAGLVPIHALAQTYRRLAQAEAPATVPLPVKNWVGLLAAVYLAGTGEWARAREAITEVVDASYRLGDWRRWQESQGIVFTLHFYQGEYAQGAEIGKAVHELALRHGHIQGQAFGLWGRGMNLLRLGRTTEAQPIIDEAIRIYEQTTDRPGQWIQYGLAAVAALRQGDAQNAIMRADQVRAQTKTAQPTTFGSVEAYAAPAEVYLSLWEADAEQGRAAWRTQAKQACRALSRFAQVFPVGQPRAELWQGAFAWLDAKPAHARLHWRKCLNKAEALAMPYEHGLAHYELGRHATGAERRRHLSCARDIFQRIEASYELERVEMLLAGGGGRRLEVAPKGPRANRPPTWTGNE